MIRSLVSRGVTTFVHFIGSLWPDVEGLSPCSSSSMSRNRRVCGIRRARQRKARIGSDVGIIPTLRSTTSLENPICTGKLTSGLKESAIFCPVRKDLTSEYSGDRFKRWPKILAGGRITRERRYTDALLIDFFALAFSSLRLHQYSVMMSSWTIVW